MIEREIINYVASKKKIERKELIEKDLILHQILSELIKDTNFSENYAFKGGTCLIKCYLDYYRFSEDLDFSWLNQNIFLNKSEKQIRKNLSLEINYVASLLEKISKKLKFKFKADKQNPKFIEFGGSSKFVTFKLWYDSIELNREQFIKIQINYIEKFKYKIKKIFAKNIIRGLDINEFVFLFPDENIKDIKLNGYDIKEIVLEKMRAILTRKGIKARDFIDLYFIKKKYNIKTEELIKEIKEKINFMLRYEKYSENLRDKIKNNPKFLLGEEKILLLVQLDESFYEFIKTIEAVTKTIISDFSKRVKNETQN